MPRRQGFGIVRDESRAMLEDEPDLSKRRRPLRSITLVLAARPRNERSSVDVIVRPPFSEGTALQGRHPGRVVPEGEGELESAGR